VAALAFTCRGHQDLAVEQVPELQADEGNLVLPAVEELSDSGKLAGNPFLRHVRGVNLLPCRERINLVLDATPIDLQAHELIG
jgi:hypothetical protein